MASLVPYDLRHEPQQTHIGKTGEVFHLLNLDAYILYPMLSTSHSKRTVLIIARIVEYPFGVLHSIESRRTARCPPLPIYSQGFCLPKGR